jgi:hypothetical protein
MMGGLFGRRQSSPLQKRIEYLEQKGGPCGPPFSPLRAKRQSRPQSRRASAEVRTTNRPDACLRKSPAKKNKRQRSNRALFQSPKRYGEYQGYRAVVPDRAGSAMPVLIGAAMIAAAILLSTLITAVGTRFSGMESQTDEKMWLIDRLTGNVYKCQAAERGKASCEAEIATGSIGERPKR